MGAPTSRQPVESPAPAVPRPEICDRTVRPHPSQPDPLVGTLRASNKPLPSWGPFYLKGANPRNPGSSDPKLTRTAPRRQDSGLVPRHYGTPEEFPSGSGRDPPGPKEGHD